VPLESSDPPTPEQIERLLGLLTDPALRPVYVHCLHGVDRTGVAMAVYRMEVEGWAQADAVAEMEHFGPHAMWRDLRAFVRDYRPTGRWRAAPRSDRSDRANHPDRRR
jgi:protein tyrosine/serine phosphatase